MKQNIHKHQTQIWSKIHSNSNHTNIKQNIQKHQPHKYETKYTQITHEYETKHTQTSNNHFYELVLSVQPYFYIFIFKAYKDIVVSSPIPSNLSLPDSRLFFFLFAGLFLFCVFKEIDWSYETIKKDCINPQWQVQESHTSTLQMPPADYHLLAAEQEPYKKERQRETETERDRERQRQRGKKKQTVTKNVGELPGETWW